MLVEGARNLCPPACAPIPSRPAPAPHEAPANPPLLLPLDVISRAAAAGTSSADAVPA